MFAIFNLCYSGRKFCSFVNVHNKATQYILTLIIDDQVGSGMFSYEFTELLLDISQLGYFVVKTLIGSAGVQITLRCM